MDGFDCGTSALVLIGARPGGPDPSPIGSATASENEHEPRARPPTIVIPDPDPGSRFSCRRQRKKRGLGFRPKSN